MDSCYCGNFEYILLPDGTAEISDYFGNEKQLHIPALFNSCYVSAIGKAALGLDVDYAEGDDLIGRPWESVMIETGIQRIGDRAFVKCHFIEQLDLPNSITTIGVGAFWECSSLRTLSLPNSVKSIGRAAFPIAHL